MMRPDLKGPRSLMRTTKERPLSKFVTRTKDGMGSVLCAAETPHWSKISPLAVFLP